MAEERQDIGIGGEEEGLLDRFCKGRGAVQLLLFNSLLGRQFQFSVVF